MKNIIRKCVTCKNDGPDYCLRGYLKRNAEKCGYYEKRNIYICGKVTGDANYREKFFKEEERLHSLGYNPVDPTSFIPANEPLEKAMRTAVRAMLLCDGVSLLPDWKKSKGAKIEARIARELGIEVRISGGWG
jgi:hypothetical protein